MTSHILSVIIDRRLNGKGKSIPNREKFLDRVRGHLKKGVRQFVSGSTIKDLSDGGTKNIHVPIRDLDEPSFRVDPTEGIWNKVYPGNTIYRTGDKIQKEEQGGGAGSGSDGDGEDGFSFPLSQDEFLDLMFEDCELPNLLNKPAPTQVEEVWQRTGFTNDGPPARMSVVRSMRNAKGRRHALRARSNSRMQELETEIETIEAELDSFCLEPAKKPELEDRLDTLHRELTALRRKISAVPFIDPIDLRFSNYSKVEIPTIQASITCIMDVSGSMEEEHKRLAKTFFLISYLFLVKNYHTVEIVFIRYHSRATEVDETEFFQGRDSGGTVLSSALDLALDIIRNRFPCALWNNYLIHATDGDNYQEDNEVSEGLLQKLLPMLQYYAYIEVAPDDNPMQKIQRALFSSSGSSTADSDLWPLYKSVKMKYENIGMGKIGHMRDAHPLFVELFKRRPSAVQE